MTITFPEGFLWGTATAAHQVEGGNWNNDWWAFEHAADTPCSEMSGDAVDHFWRYPSDIAMLAELGFGLYRFSGGRASKKKTVSSRATRSTTTRA